MITVYVDGASCGNPGKSGVGYVCYRDDVLIKQQSVFIGIQSNNFAEYMAVIFPLSDLIALGEKKCRVFSDSKLICEQLNGRYKVKHQNIYPLYVLARHIIKEFDDFSITHIPREENSQADSLAKKATGFLV